MKKQHANDMKPAAEGGQSVQEVKHCIGSSNTYTEELGKHRQTVASKNKRTNQSKKQWSILRAYYTAYAGIRALFYKDTCYMCLSMLFSLTHILTKSRGLRSSRSHGTTVTATNTTTVAETMGKDPYQ